MRTVHLASRAAPLTAALAAIVSLWTVPALAQDATPPEEPATAEEAPVAGSEPAPAADAQAGEAAAPPAEAAAPAPDTISVQTTETESVPEGNTELEAIEVTGSRLKRTDYETAQPVFSISREDIERTGLTDISQILSKIPAAGNASLNTQAQARTTSLGETNLDLRNLGSTRTLLLVNGRRWANGLISTQPSVADFNTIPTSIIERIEVLKDGASAIYGSDAIGGVVNVITRKDYQGWGLSSQVGQYVAEGDGEKQQHSLSWGNLSDGNSLFANFSFTEERASYANNRNFTAVPNPALGFSRWGNSIAGGRFLFVPTEQNGAEYQCPNLQAGLASGEFAGGPVAPIGGAISQTAPLPAGLQLCDLRLIPDSGGGERADYRQRDPNNIADRYNVYDKAVLQQPSERYTLFTTASHQLSERVGMTFEGLYTARRSTGVYGELIIFGGNAGGNDAFISAANTMNPFQQDIGNSAAIEPGYGFWVMRLPDDGRTMWTFNNVADTLRLAWGLNGDFDGFSQNFAWDAGYVTVKAKNDEDTLLYRLDRLALAVGPSVDCVPDDGCVPLDVFHGVDGVTDEMLDYLYENTVQHNDGRQDIVYGSLATSFDAVGNILAGPLDLAAGFEYRRDEFSTVPDELIQAGLTFLNQQQPLQGRSYAREAFLELGVPVLADLPFAQALDLSLAGRWSQYPGFADVVTYKSGLRWKPIDDLLVRGTYSTGFRAPNIGELYLTPAQSFDPMEDPCVTPSPQARQNCEADLVNPQLAEQTAGQPYALWSGDKNLDPEKSRNLTYGLVYSPSFVPDLNFYLDFYKIEVDDYITIGGTLAQFILDSCYEAPTNARTYCDRVHRDEESGQTLISVDTPYMNYSSVKTAGVDGGFDYVLPVPAAFGRMKVALDASRLTQYDIVRPRPGRPDATTDLVGVSDLLTGWPKWKGGASLTWSLDQFSASWATRMAYSMTESCVDPFQPAPWTYGVCSDPDPAIPDDPTTADDPSTPDVIENDESREDLSRNKWDTIFYHNVQLGYDLPTLNTSVTLGIQNVFDQDPVRSYGLSGYYWYNYDPNQYETPGRFSYVRFDMKF